MTIGARVVGGVVVKVPNNVSHNAQDCCIKPKPLQTDKQPNNVKHEVCKGALPLSIILALYRNT